MRHFGVKLLAMLSLWFAVGAFSGCVDGPFYRMWYRKQWEEDEKYAKEHAPTPTFYTRLEELKKVRSSAKAMSSDEQVRVAQQLTQTLTQDACPSYRAEIVRTLAVVPGPAAAAGVRLAFQDKDASVRTVACHALGKHQDPESLQTLALVVAKDPDLDVRTAATKELGRYKDQEAVRALAVALDDTDPALQHVAVQSLHAVTGKNFGDSVPAWRQFVRGEQVKPGEGSSLAEKLRKLF